MKKEYELALLGSGAILTAFASIIIAQSVILSPNRALQTVMLAKVFLTSLNIVLLLGLTANYLKIYSEMKTPLSRSLLAFSTALMLYAVTSSPLTHVLLGFDIISVGPFTFLPDLFVTAATTIILWESYQ
jgi:hypothetical protein